MRFLKILPALFILFLALPSSAKLLITEIAPDTYAPNDADEFLRITCVGKEERLSEYLLSDLEEAVPLPDVILRPGESIYLTRNESLFKHYMRENCVEISLPRLSNSGDEVILLRGESVEDAVRYGKSREIEGWKGKALKAPREGEILKRWHGDTDTKEDWIGERSFYIGQSEFEVSNFSGEVICFTTESSLNILLKLIDKARNSICISSYVFDHPIVAERLRKAAERGVEIRVLLEGDPIGGFHPSESLKALSEFSDVRLMSSEDVRDRYRFVHAKYVVFDSKAALVTTENLNENGFPLKDGNKGWGVVLIGESAKFLQKVFEDDWNGYDVRKFHSEGEIQEVEVKVEEGEIFQCSTDYELFVLPDAGFSPLMRSIESADEFLYVEQQYVEEDGTILREILKKASEGVKVRIILDDGCEGLKSTLEALSRSNGWDLEVRVLENVHTKGIVTEDLALITSVNMNDESMKENREAGVILYGDAAKFFKEAFERDWDEAGEEISTPIFDILSGVLIAVLLLSVRHFLVRR